MGGFCCRTFMKVLAILLCLIVALSFADDASVTCTFGGNIACSNPASLDLEDWTEVTVNGTKTACFQAAFEADDSDEGYFVLAVRPGDDAVNAGNAQVNARYKGANTTELNLCVQPQAGQVEDDMDFTCASTNGTFAQGSTGNVTILVFSNSAAGNSSTVEIYAGFADGSACSASMVSSGGSWWWIVIVLIVIVVIIVIVAAVGGFLYMKKKKSSYQLYEDA